MGDGANFSANRFGSVTGSMFGGIDDPCRRQSDHDLSHHAMLPHIAANAGFDDRDNVSGGVARFLITGHQEIQPVTSVENKFFSADLSLSWNVLDFWLSYIRVKQAADDILIVEEAHRRVAHRAMQDLRAVSAERILPSLKLVDEWVRGAITRLCRERESIRWRRNCNSMLRRQPHCLRVAPGCHRRRPAPKDLTQEQRVSSLALEVHTRWAKSKELLK